ncbi:MAG TPA: DUF58 domain-containing protein [Acidobacteriaceae bacterium]|nr:DUF58 domain-containing protein [Acidobacteriaceae bacterium]
MLSTLIPPPQKAAASPSRFGFALTTRALLLLTVGCLLALPGFLRPHWAWVGIMAAWDALMVMLVIVDAALLPSPAKIQVERRFLNSPVLGEPTEIELEILQNSNQILDIRISDALHPALAPMPLAGRVRAFPRDPVRVNLKCIPNTRGDVRLGKVYLRYRGVLGLAERWAAADISGEIRVFPPMERSPESTQLYLLRIRQIALQKRRLRLRGVGREFESLREYQRGDEVRNIAWPATARRGKLITREFTTERSQQVWIVLDAGRLSRTAFSLRRKAGERVRQSIGDTFGEEDLVLSLTQLDQSTGAAVALAQTVMQAGDKAGLLVYGQSIQQQLLPAGGTGHLRQFVDALSLVRAERSEANHLRAAARLKHLQRRRGLILWITELADSARRPEVVDAVIDLSRRHLVLLVVLRNPELDSVAAQQPANVAQMYMATASEEIIERRRTLLAQLRAHGVLVVETSAGCVKADAINQYLDVKARGLL